MRPDKPFRLAVGSFIEDYNNRVEIIAMDESRSSLRGAPALSFSHPYPPTKLAFIPDRDASRPDLLASSGDHLRLWRIGEDGVTLEKLLNNAKSAAPGPGAAPAPITSFDWNDVELRRVATSSIDTTCTVWDVERGVVEAQLIAHDREVYDVAWGGAGVFASVSADASVRVFDLRDKSHSTIIYESPAGPEAPLLRLAWNRLDPRLLATFALDSAKTLVLDIRSPSAPVAELARHTGAVNAVAWAPHSAAHLCTAADDAGALIWDLAGLPQEPPPPGQPPAGAGMDPILAYHAGAEVNQLQWSAAQPEWVAVCFANRTQILRV